jgi:flagellar protein FlaG
MTISPLQATLAGGGTDAQNSSEKPGPQQAARNRQILQAIRAINDKETLGPGSELRFSVDRHTNRPLIQIVDRATNEVLNQIPPEEVLRLAAVLEEIAGHPRLA